MLQGSLKFIDRLEWGALFAGFGEGRTEGGGFGALELGKEGVGAREVGLGECTREGDKARVASWLEGCIRGIRNACMRTYDGGYFDNCTVSRDRTFGCNFCWTARVSVTHK